ncbi:MAG: DUF6544 family protein [Saprospiraceae bacterium]
MRYFFAFVLLVHGLIHFMGLAKAFGYAEINNLTQPISRPAGAAWLLAALLFVVGTGLFLWRKDAWWMVVAPAVVVSQILIFMSWRDAKFGTVANLIALAAVVLAIAAWQFDGMVRREMSAFLPEKTAAAPKIVTPEMLAGLPPVVRRWLETSNIVGKPMARNVRLRQRGEMMTKPGGQWMPFEAEQYCTVEKPGFLWRTEMQAAPFVPIVGRDKFEDGRGHMLIKLLSLVPIADAKGPEIDQGSALRNLGEICWFPSAALRDYIVWEPLDSLSAKATMTVGGKAVSGIFRFNEAGDLASFEAKRYYDRKEGATLEDWFIASTAWRDFGGIRVPYKHEVTWRLKTGDFTWLKLEVEELKELKS